MNKPHKTVSLSADQRLALEALCRRRKVEALVWKRARAFLLLDAEEDAGTVCRILDIGPTVLTEWRFAFSGAGLSFPGLKDYSQRRGHLSVTHERALKARFAKNPARNVDGVCAYVPAEYGQSYSSPGAAGLMRRPGFEYKKPRLLPAQADEVKQAAFIAMYEALMAEPAADGMVVFSDAVHPEHQSRPAHGWFPKGQKTALKATSGRKRLNIQGALDLETFRFTFVEGEKINAQTTRAMLEKPERNNPTKTTIHVFVDNARYHHARILQPWLHSPERRVKLKFLPAYAPHLNPIERLWGVMHECITHNRHYATFNCGCKVRMSHICKVEVSHFPVEAGLECGRGIGDHERARTEPCGSVEPGYARPDDGCDSGKWRDFRDTVTDNFRIVSLKEYKLI